MGLESESSLEVVVLVYQAVSKSVVSVNKKGHRYSFLLSEQLEEQTSFKMTIISLSDVECGERE
jgi:hypothetical protein